MRPQIFFACIVTQAVGDNTWAYYFFQERIETVEI